MQEIKNPRVNIYGFKTYKLKEYNTILEWCKENFGSSVKRWEHRDHFWGRNLKRQTGYGAIYFSDPTDAMAFKLKWT